MVKLSPDSDFWEEPINDEIDSIMGNNTKVLEELPPGCNPLIVNLFLERK